jgi:glycosyltransferase involved in cell wall biosynthesis
VRNAGLRLEKTIGSVLKQTYDNVEYIVIDGRSSDDTLDIVRRYDMEIDYWLSEVDAGIYDAMNKGVGLCLGEFIGIIGAGDWYERNAVEKALHCFSRSKADVVYGDVEIVDAETALSYRRQSKSELMPKTMSSISHPTVFAKRSIYVSRLFDTKMRVAADYDLFLGLYTHGYRFEHSGGLVTHILTGGVSGSFLTQIEVFKVHRKYYGFFYATSQFLLSALRYAFFESRRVILKCLLSPERFAAARTWWLRYKGRKDTDDVTNKP